MAEEIFEVWASGPDGTSVLTGRASPIQRRDRTARQLAFEYDGSWLRHGRELSPDLPLVSGPAVLPVNRSVPGAFEDAMPDAWGRALVVRELGRPVEDVEMLLLGSDETRQGDLRFRSSEGVWLAEPDGRLPGVKDLAELVDASARFLAGHEIDPGIKRLIGAGGTAGGARPKSIVREATGELAIAKFPRRKDEFDVSAWEAVAAELSSRAGIETPPWCRVVVGQDQSVFVTRRFDRDSDLRVPYWSFRTLFGLGTEERPDYAKLARGICLRSTDPAADGEQLLRRAVLNAMINNHDDHMRNFGVIPAIRGDGLRLAPSFDVNPSIDLDYGTPLVTGGDQARRDPLTVIPMAESFRLSAEQAREIIAEVSDMVAGWRAIAESLDIDAAEIQRMRPAFSPIG